MITGRDEMATTQRGSIRADAAANNKLLAQGGVAITPELTDFRFRLVQANKTVYLDDLIESAEWEDSSDAGSLNSWPTLSGSVGLRQPKGGSSEMPSIQPNDIVDCWLGSERLWRMRITKPTYTASDGTVKMEMQDEMRQLAMSSAHFRFVKGTGHKYGWTPDQIARNVCSRFRIPAGPFFTVKYRGAPIHLTKLDQTTSPTGIIRAAYSEAQKRTATRYVMRWDYGSDAGRLLVEPMTVSDTTYVFTENQISEANVEVQSRGDFATALLCVWWKPKPKGWKPPHGATGSKKKWKPTKHTLRVVSSGTYKLRNGKSVTIPSGIIERYGYIERRVEMTAASEGEARDRTVNSLAARLRPRKTLSFTTKGIPSVRRGDFIRVNLPEQGFDNKQLWVQGVKHALDSDYTMEVTARFDNPMDPGTIKKEQDAAKRYRAKLARKKKKKS